MRYLFPIALYAFVILSCKESPKADTSLTVPGLLDTVEVIRDSVGINHIYAQNQHDLFFAQGYCAAKDRLFQFELWRRQATGTTAELLGPRAVERDMGTRLFAFRGDMQTEMAHYHPDGVEILTAYTEGVNAYIEEALQSPSTLPLPFKALGISPQKWTPEVIISRHQGLLGNIKDELAIGRAVATLGPDKVKEYLWFHPKDPLLELDPSITSELLEKDILAPYNAYRQSLTFLPQDILPEYRTEKTMAHLPTYAPSDDDTFLGSNNWVTQPHLSKNG
ncbi:MAG: penicillin acylase family protein, partial [Flavobacteriaceae bacterium]